MSVKTILTLVGVIVLILIGVAVSNAWWGPRLDHAITQLLGAQDQGASDKIAKQGAVADQNLSDQHDKTKDQINASVSHATRTIIESPSAKTPLPAADADRLRAADLELCKLQPICTSTSGLAPTISRPTPAPVTPKRQGPVRDKHTPDAGDTDLR